MSLTVDINLNGRLQSSCNFLPILLHGGLKTAIMLQISNLHFSSFFDTYTESITLFLVTPFISARFDIQLKMGGVFVGQEQLHSFYFYSFNKFSFWVFALYEYCLERDLWQSLQLCTCQYLPKIFILFPSPAVCLNIFLSSRSALSDCRT